jgi:hypothetical protein
MIASLTVCGVEKRPPLYQIVPGDRLRSVGSLLERLFGGGRARRTATTCYLRENGPIAYELDLFRSSPRERVDAMMESPLVWAWKSGNREWTELTRISLSAFLADVPSGVLLFGAEEELPIHLSDAMVAEWIRHFARIQPGPLAAFVSVSAERQLLFVQQHASETVNELLANWGIDKGSAERKSYARLGPHSLESIAGKL